MTQPGSSMKEQLLRATFISDHEKKRGERAWNRRELASSAFNTNENSRYLS